MIGFRICQRERTVELDLVEKFKTIPVANISDMISRMAAGGPRLRPMHAGGAMAGAALTVKTRPGDNLMVHKALDMAVTGDVVVVDAGGDLTNSIMGEIMLAHAANRGVGGIVINGSVRDCAAIRRSALPVFAAGVTHRGPYKDGPGEINVPIAIDGMLIAPGDLVAGDDDGVVSVPLDDAEAVYRAAYAKHELELVQLDGASDGTLDRSWVDETLRRLGCEMESCAAIAAQGNRRRVEP